MANHEELFEAIPKPESGSVLYLPQEIILPPEELMPLLKKPFLEMARMVAGQEARSYRGFNVGAVVLSSFGNGAAYGFAFGANRKPGPNAGRVCAEQLGIAWSLNPGLDQPKPDRILAFYVWGEPQPDRVSGKLAPTLHPCGDCRTMFELLPEITDDTMIFTAGPDGQTEEFSVRELIDFHKNDIAS